MTCAFANTDQQCISFRGLKSLSIFALVLASHTVIHCATLASDGAQSGGWHSVKMSEEEFAALNSSKLRFQISGVRASGDGKSVNVFLSSPVHENAEPTSVRPFFGIVSISFQNNAIFLLRLPALRNSQRIFFAPLDGERQFVAIFDDAETQSVRSAIIWTPLLSKVEQLTMPLEERAWTLTDLAVNVARGVPANEVFGKRIDLPSALSSQRFNTHPYIPDRLSRVCTVTQGFTPEQVVFFNGTGSLAVASYDTTHAIVTWEIDRAEVAKISGIADGKQDNRELEVWGPIARGGFPHGMPLYVSGRGASGFRDSALLKIEADGNMKVCCRPPVRGIRQLPVMSKDGRLVFCMGTDFDVNTYLTTVWVYNLETNQEQILKTHTTGIAGGPGDQVVSVVPNGVYLISFDDPENRKLLWRPLKTVESIP